MDGVGNTSGGVLVLGATNVPWELDPGILVVLLLFLFYLQLYFYFSLIDVLLHYI